MGKDRDKTAGNDTYHNDITDRFLENGIGKHRKEFEDMSYCTNCGTQIKDSVRFCPHCGTPIHECENVTQNTKTKDTVKTAATIAGTAVGVSLLSRMARRRRRPPMPPHGGMMVGPGGRGPMGGPGGIGHR